MNRAGYNLPELPLPAHMPGWAKDLTVATQAVMDAQYLHGPGGLDNFYDQAEGWITTEAFQRGSNRAYVPNPFKMAIPRRQVVAYDEAGNMTSALLAADPNIHMPELPALPPEQPPTPLFGGTHPAADPTQAMAQMMAAVMTKLVTIEQLLRTIAK
jgi:hypothetical protein